MNYSFIKIRYDHERKSKLRWFEVFAFLKHSMINIQNHQLIKRLYMDDMDLLHITFCPFCRPMMAQYNDSSIVTSSLGEKERKSLLKKSYVYIKCKEMAKKYFKKELKQIPIPFFHS